MVIRNSKSPVVEYNTVAYSSRYETGNSIFNFDTIDCIMQYNESYGNTGGGLDEHERGGFDADWNSEGTIIQYNYSHDNYYFAAIMRKYNKGVTVRYNISQNELTGVFHYGFPSKDELTQCKIYNNTFYFKSTKGPKVFTLGEKSKDSKTPINTTLQNNIFYFSDSGGWGTTLPSSFSEDHNLFYNFASTNTIDKSDVQEDPKLENPGQGGTDIDMKASDRLVGYQLQLGSPAIDAGTEIQNNGGQDFWGHSLYYIAPDIGAYEYRQQGNENGHGNHNPDLVVKTFRANIGTSKDVLPVKYIWEIKNKSNQQFTCRIDFDGDGINDKVINPCPKNGSQLGLLRKGVNKKKYKSRLTVTAGSSIGGSKISVIQVPARRIADIDAEDGYVIALKDNHSLVAWGDSTAGTLNIPTESLNGVTEISGGDSYAMALNADGTITTWGAKHESANVLRGCRCYFWWK